MTRRAWSLLAALALLALAGALTAALLLQEKGVTPRALAPYVAKRTSGHNPTIVQAGQFAARTLVALDRGEPGLPGPLPTAFGAQSGPPTSGPAGGKVQLVASADDARRAFGAAMPGDVISFLPGRYRFTGAAPAALQAGTRGAPITVRAAQPGTVTIEMDAVEGFLVNAPWWRFENLIITGVCQHDSDCEHAFHVVGAAHHFSASNNTITNFNAHFKINGVDRRFPDDGLLELNTLTNSGARRTANPVTPIDLVAASGWTIRRNLIADFSKAEGDGISYGGFAKGGGARNVFEQNAVLCEYRLRGLPGQRVGLSLGGGGTGKPYCRDGKCVTEQDQGVIRANLIAACSDDGIYLNNAAASRVSHNTLSDTSGIQVRFAASSADIEGNVVDGAIRSRDGAVVRLNDNLETAVLWLYAGYHGQRSRFADAGAFDFRWRGDVPRRSTGAAGVPDLCQAARPAAPAYGAFEDISACNKAR